MSVKMTSRLAGMLEQPETARLNPAKGVKRPSVLVALAVALT